MIRKILFVVFSLFSILIGLYPLVYLFQEQNQGFLSSKLELLSNSFWITAFYTHIIFGGIALLTGWSQFIPKWRNKFPKFHRNLGKLYVISALLSSVAAIFLGFYANGGIIPSLGFISLGIIWFYTTYKAFTSIKKRNLIKHKKMMIFSYAACFSAVTLRFYTPFLNTGFEPELAYRIVAWLCWVPNIFVAYLITRNLNLKNHPI